MLELQRVGTITPDSRDDGASLEAMSDAGSRDDGASSATTSNDAWAWWRSLGAPRYVCAPMVDQSERAFRAVARRHGVGLCYSPMLVASALGDASYRAAYLDAPDARDRPLFVQVGGSGEAFVAGAARVARAGGCDAVDVNLGCPQSCARRGGYGAFTDEDDAVALVAAVAAAVKPTRVTCKIRAVPERDAPLVPDRAATARYAARLAAAGASCVAVHARTREAKGRGAADWAVVAAVVAAVDVPVIGNGDVRTRRDADALIAETGCAAVMSAEALLADPRLFGDAAGGDAADACREYLRVARREDAPPPVSWARAHVVAVLHAALAADGALAARVEAAPTLAALEDALPGAAGACAAAARGPTPEALAAVLARGRAERRRCKDARMRGSARAPAKRRADGPPSDRQCVAIAENNLKLCAGGCGNPAKHACARGACRACCGALGGGADCGHHAPKKKRRRAADPD